MIVTIIGSRETPKPVLDKMTEVAAWMMRTGIIVRSGAAGGADSTVNEAYKLNYEQNRMQQMPEVYIPWAGFGKDIQYGINYIVKGDDVEARTIAKTIHPAWERCSRGVQALHTRNVCQILGADIKTPSTVVLYWCKEKAGRPTGGTATAVNLAKYHNVKTVNMLHDNWAQALRKALDMPI